MEFLDHFRAMRAAVDLPLVAYEIPVSAGSKLPGEVEIKLAWDGARGTTSTSLNDTGCAAVRRRLAETGLL